MLDTIEDARRELERERGDERAGQSPREMNESGPTRDGDQHHPLAFHTTRRASRRRDTPPGTRLRAHAHLSPRAVARPYPRTARGRRRARGRAERVRQILAPSRRRRRVVRRHGRDCRAGPGRRLIPPTGAIHAPRSLRAQVLFPDADGESEGDADPSSATRRPRRIVLVSGTSTTTISSPRSTRAASATSWDVSPTAGVWTRARSGRTSSPPGNNNGWRLLVCTCVARLARFSTRRRRRWTKRRRRRCTRWRGGARGRSSAWDIAGRCSGTTRGCCDSSRRLGAARGRGWRNPSRVAVARRRGGCDGVRCDS